MPTNQEIFNSQMNALANSINIKAGTTGSKSLTQLKTAVDSISTGGSFTEYSITTSVTNGTYVGASTIIADTSYVSATATITITASSGYSLPSSVTVSGATSSYNATTGVITLSSPTGNVSVSAVCQSSSNVTIQLPRPYYTPGATATLTIYDGQYNSGSIIYTTTITKTFTLDTTYQCSSGYLTIATTEYVWGYRASGNVTIDTESQNPRYVTFKVDGDGTILGQVSCFVKGTKITLSDYTTKNIEEITYDDELLVWNFYDGKLDKAKPSWIMPQTTTTTWHKVTLSDGTILKLIGPGEICHRLFNVTKQQMLYANECVGDDVYNQNGELVKVISCEIVDEIVDIYNITTKKYLNCFANGILTGSRLNNMYHINNMKYDSDVRLISKEEEKERWAIRGMEVPEWLE